MTKFIIKTILILVCISLVAYIFTREITKVYSLYRENDEIKKRIEDLKKENEDLQKQITVLNNEIPIIEKIAREELGMIKNSEKIYKFQE
ncbi:MAG: cell division protein FtsL [Deltaproteobacteria bacterium]|nr:cell division protein FtsL [Deltaproteobacteria bacterium]